MNTITDYNKDKIIHSLYNIIHTTRNKRPLQIKKSLIQENFKVPKGYNSFFFPEEIKSFITKNQKIQFKCSFTISTIKVNIYLIVFRENIDISYFEQFMKKIIHWLFICDLIGTGKLCGNTLDVFIYLTPFKKLFPSKRSIMLQPIHVNSGFSTLCQEENEVVVFREEEWFKVFIHETFHSYGMDINQWNDAIGQKQILKVFHLNKKNTNILLSETYTEVWSRIMNTAFYSYQDTNNYPEFRIHFTYTIKMESIFSIYKGKSILDFIGIQYSNLTQGNYPTSMYREKVSIFSYFILSSILLHSPYEFIQLCCDFNNNFFIFENNNSTLIYAFLKLIKKKYKNTQLIKLYNTFKTDFSSLRMTFIDH